MANRPAASDKNPRKPPRVEQRWKVIGESSVHYDRGEGLRNSSVQYYENAGDGTGKAREDKEQKPKQFRKQ